MIIIKCGFNKAEKWYIHKLVKVLESEVNKIIWNFLIQTDKILKILEHSRPNITVINKKGKKCLLIDPTCPSDTHIKRKEEGKCTKYSKLKYEIEKMKLKLQ